MGLMRLAKKKGPVGRFVVLGFGSLFAAMFVAACVVGLFPSQQERCESYCVKRGQHGELAYVYSEGRAAGMHSRGPTECRCKT